MMNVFVFDTKALTEELMQARLDNMLARRDHLENFVEEPRGEPEAVPTSVPSRRSSPRRRW